MIFSNLVIQEYFIYRTVENLIYEHFLIRFKRIKIKIINSLLVYN